jgi:hypothetical protein
MGSRVFFPCILMCSNLIVTLFFVLFVLCNYLLSAQYAGV